MSAPCGDHTVRDEEILTCVRDPDHDGLHASLSEEEGELSAFMWADGDDALFTFWAGGGVQ